MLSPYTPEYTISGMMRGDTWEGIDSIDISFTGGIPAALISGRMQFRKTKARNGPPIEELNTDNGRLVILDSGSNGITWSFNIPTGNLNLPVGTSYWDLETIDERGFIKTYLKGSICLEQDVTR